MHLSCYTDKKPPMLLPEQLLPLPVSPEPSLRACPPPTSGRFPADICPISSSSIGTHQGAYELHVPLLFLPLQLGFAFYKCFYSQVVKQLLPAPCV
jgi:hypothetical protein